MRFTRSTWAALAGTATYAGIATFASAGPALAGSDASPSPSAGGLGNVASAGPSANPSAAARGPVAGATPSTAKPGAPVLFWVVCGSAAKSAILFGVTLGLPEHIPLRKDTREGLFTGTMTLPASIMPGTYAPSVDCSNHVVTTVTVVVHSAPAPTATTPAPTTPAPTPSASRYLPAAPPVTGDGTTSDAVGGPLTVVGAGLLGLGGLAGVIALWRRHPGSGA